MIEGEIGDLSDIVITDNIIFWNALNCIFYMLCNLSYDDLN